MLYARSERRVQEVVRVKQKKIKIRNNPNLDSFYPTTLTLVPSFPFFGKRNFESWRTKTAINNHLHCSALLTCWNVACLFGFRAGRTQPWPGHSTLRTACLVSEVTTLNWFCRMFDTVPPNLQFAGSENHNLLGNAKKVVSWL